MTPSLTEKFDFALKALTLTRAQLSAELGLHKSVVATTAMRGAAYEGFYRSTRPISQHPGRFVHDYLMVRRDAGGLLRFEMIADGVIARGWILLLHSQLFTICEELTSGAFAFAMFNGVNGPRAGVLDGLILNLSGGAERSPTATAVIMERIGDLSGVNETDDAVFASLRRRDVYARAESLSEDLKAHLVRDIGPLALAAGGDWLLRSPPSRSRSGGPDRPPDA